MLLRHPFTGLNAATVRRALVIILAVLESAGVVSSTMVKSTYSDAKSRCFAAVPGHVESWLATHSSLPVPVCRGFAAAIAASGGTVTNPLPSRFSIPRALSVSLPLLRVGSNAVVPSSHMNLVTGFSQAMIHSPIASEQFSNHTKSTCPRIGCLTCLLSDACNKLCSPRRSTQFEVHVPFGYDSQLQAVFGDCASAAQMLQRLCSKLCHECGLKIGFVTKIEEVSELWLVLQL